MWYTFDFRYFNKWHIKSNQIKFIEQQRARGASYRLLKHKINNYYMHTLCAKK